MNDQLWREVAIFIAFVLLFFLYRLQKVLANTPTASFTFSAQCRCTRLKTRFAIEEPHRIDRSQVLLCVGQKTAVPSRVVSLSTGCMIHGLSRFLYVQRYKGLPLYYCIYVYVVYIITKGQMARLEQLSVLKKGSTHHPIAPTAATRIDKFSIRWVVLFLVFVFCSTSSTL